MASVQRRLCKVRLQLLTTAGTTDVWLDLHEFLDTIGVTRIRGRTVLCDKTGNFRFKVGIQTYSLDPEFPDSPLNPSTGTGVANVSTLVRNFVDFDPTVAGNGQIGAKPGYRVGIFYSSSDANPARGEVIVGLSADV